MYFPEEKKLRKGVGFIQQGVFCTSCSAPCLNSYNSFSMQFSLVFWLSYSFCVVSWNYYSEYKGSTTFNVLTSAGGSFNLLHTHFMSEKEIRINSVFEIFKTCLFQKGFISNDSFSCLLHMCCWHKMWTNKNNKTLPFIFVLLIVRVTPKQISFRYYVKNHWWIMELSTRYSFRQK